MPDGSIRRYYGCGTTAPEIAERLGWTQQNVWMREPERNYVLREHPNLFTDLDQAIAYVLGQPDSVHENPRGMGDFYFIVSGERLRAAGLLLSRRTRLIDAVVELRAVLDGSFLRLFHVAPALRNNGGRQLWP